MQPSGVYSNYISDVAPYHLITININTHEPILCVNTMINNKQSFPLVWNFSIYFPLALCLVSHQGMYRLKICFILEFVSRKFYLLIDIGNVKIFTEFGFLNQN